MAKIIYGVMGDAGGHINRAIAVAKELPQHEFLFVGGGKVKEAQKAGYSYSPLPMLSTILKDNNVLIGKTASHLCKNIIQYNSTVGDLCRVIEAFKPDLAITDYEFFLPKAARRVGIECISLDHQHIITNCTYPALPEEKVSRFITTNLIKCLFSTPNSFLVSSFYSLPPRDNRTEIVPPIIHRDILDYAPIDDDHIVVYMRTGINKSLFDGLLSMRRECRIYGMQETGTQKNLHFRAPSRQGFLEDLASCAYVVCNAGHTLTSEALQLGKPVLAFPAHLFYEQYFNAYHLEQMNFGRIGNPFADSAATIVDFERNLKGMRSTVKNLDLFGNEIAARKISEFVGA